MEALNKVLQELAPHQATLVAVSKTKPVEKILEMYQHGQRDFGENRVQELVDKAENLPKDIHWHLIGHLQSNKVKYIAPFVHLIHSVESLKLLAEINKQAAKHDRIIGCLLQFKIAEEDTKYGLDLEAAQEMIRSERFANFKNIRIEGVMGMATFTDNQIQVRSEFKTLAKIFHTLKTENFQDNPSFKHISMGMSGDYAIALEEGSTMVRIGSLLFGARG